MNSNNASGLGDIGLPLAMAYVPIQDWRKLYSNDVGFERGTIFSELDLPFLGEEGVPDDR